MAAKYQHYAEPVAPPYRVLIYFESPLKFRYGLLNPTARHQVASSNSHRQSAADLVQLVREIQVGMDVDSDGRPDVDASRIYLYGSSWGGGIATVFFAVEPDVRVGVLNVPFDPVPSSILSCVRRSDAGAYLSARKPSLLNPVANSRITFVDGCGVGTPLFNEDFPLRNMLPLTVGLKGGGTMVIQSPVTNQVTGAMEIQEALENVKWVGQAGSPLAYAPHLRKAPLAGMQPKSVIVQMAKGDQSAHNPSDTAIARAGDLADRTLYFRHDLYRRDNPSAPKNPHTFATSLAEFNSTTLGVQDAIGQFFESDGSTIVVPEPREYFEFPIIELREMLNYRSIP